jgi:hypothetical protein
MSTLDEKIGYSPREFAKLFEPPMGLSTVFKRIRTGRIEAVKDGYRKTLITPAAKEKYLASLTPIVPRNQKT